MRSHQRIYVPASAGACSMNLLWHIAEPVKSTVLNSCQKSAHKKGMASPQGLIVCLNGEDVFNPEYVFNNIQWNNKHIAEYVIHPAVENDSPYFGKIVERIIVKNNIKANVLYGHFINPGGLTVALLGRKMCIPSFFAYGESSIHIIDSLNKNCVSKILKDITGVIAVSNKIKWNLLKIPLFM